jgi:ribose 5-phosphate isomerase B
MIALASDHAGFEYKERVKELLAARGLAFLDFGTHSAERCDYPDFAHAAARAIERGECDRAILVCGSGIGIGIAANRHAGVRAATCQSVEAARMSRLHNDANALAIGQRLLAWDEAAAIVEAWLDTPFEGGRHTGRIRKIETGGA